MTCGWVPDHSCCSGWADYTPEAQARADAIAVQVLWALTGQQYGACPVVVRPCAPRCNPSSYETYGVLWDSPSGGGWLPYIDAGAWRNCGCCGACCCGVSSEVWLPPPVAAVTSVTIDGLALDPASYRVDEAQFLVRQDGGRWPECQNLDVASGEGTFVVSYTRGIPLPAAGAWAAGLYACQLAAACGGGGPCALPERVQSISRSGVSVDLISPEDMVVDGLTGIPEVDQWIGSVNPGKLRRRPVIYDPSRPNPRITTWP